ncbi:DUF503 domain-containing protein [Candidatus Contubernalis alkaliaceticus]|uniref:DUF503 domain-containing protein n=1 Tax=Candidatus Contubernalis alkaliaceticus TaxID=338645 RepID=UPI001F4BF3D8|nr:DUF503 domain-containing protein [Candidatus Contubernalis alkalaceticus]UNC91837.1 DUF503 domain-containing protein [Candidatus Contubernalis alkalaceticus]
MVIGLCTLEMFFPNLQSLKDKRRILKSIQAKLRQKYNISVAEIGDHDKWQKTTLAVACVSNDSGFASQVVNQIVRELENHKEGYVIDFKVEII